MSQSKQLTEPKKAPKRKQPIENAVIREVYKQADVAKALAQNLAAILKDDKELLTDTIEGETDLFESFDKALEFYFEREAFIAALKENKSNMETRIKRLESQQESIKAAVKKAMEMANIETSIERPLATIVKSEGAESVEIFDASILPSKYEKRADPKPDKVAIRKDLKAGKDVPGARFERGEPVIVIRRK